MRKVSEVAEKMKVRRLHIIHLEPQVGLAGHRVVSQKAALRMDKKACATSEDLWQKYELVNME